MVVSPHRTNLQLSFPSIWVESEFEYVYIHIIAVPEFTWLHTDIWRLSSCNILQCVCSNVPKCFNLFILELVFGLLGFAGDPLFLFRIAFLLRISSLTRLSFSGSVLLALCLLYSYVSHMRRR